MLLFELRHLLLAVGGFAILMVNQRGARATMGKRGTHMLPALAMVVLVAVHNVVLRNRANLFGAAPPAVVSLMGFALEAAPFSLVAFTVTRALLQHR